MTESDLKKKVKAILNRHGVYYFMPIPRFNMGVQDFVCCVNGWYLAIETKTEKNKLTVHQARHKTAVESCNGFSLVIRPDDLHMLEEFIVEITSHEHSVHTLKARSAATLLG